MSALIFSAVSGLNVTLLVCVLVLVTRHLHGQASFDTLQGTQKFHKTMTPRIGGLPIALGVGVAAFAAPTDIRAPFLIVVACGLIALLPGMIEDLSKKIPALIRLGLTMLACLLYALWSGDRVTRFDVSGWEGLLQSDWGMIGVTVFVLTGLVQAVNIIDGFHGLSTGSTIIMFMATSIVAYTTNQEVFAMALIALITLTGFLAVNFPFGYIFPGDGGAYFLGFLLGTINLKLIGNDSALSPWTGLIITAYPFLETIYAIIRKSLRKRHNPLKPDELHLHMLIHNWILAQFGKTNAETKDRWANPLTSVAIWAGVALSLGLALFLVNTGVWARTAFLVPILVYAAAYGWAYWQNQRGLARAT